MKTILLGATILIGLAAPAWATGINDIEIDATTAGTVKTLAIIQDDTHLANQVSATSGGGSSLLVVGPWKTVSITQSGGNNLFYGSLTTDATSSTASVTASYTGGKNTQALTIGSTTAPVNPTVAIAVANTGVTTNAITDTLDGTALAYNLAVSGTGNSVSNTVAVSGGITLAQGGVGGYGITGDNNSVSNTVSGVTSFTHYLTIAGSNNTVTNAASNGGDKSITQAIASSGNTLTMTLNGSGSQAAAMSVDSASTVNYTLLDSASGSTANILLSNVVGAGASAAVVNVTQTSNATGAVADVTIAGGAFTMGSSLAGGAGVIITQNSANANLNMTSTAAANGYTVHVTQ